MNATLFSWMGRSVLACLLVLASGGAASGAESQAKVTNLSLEGAIKGQNIEFVLMCDVETGRVKEELPLIVGEAAIEELISPKEDGALRYDAVSKTYFIALAAKSKQHVEVRFAAKANVDGKDGWRIASFDVPSSSKRELKVMGDRADLEIQFPDAMRVQKTAVEGGVQTTAILGPGKPFAVRYKPQVQALDAKLVASMDANVIGTVSAGAMRVDALLSVGISQGKLNELHFTVPAALNVMQVRGQYIRDWSQSGTGDKRTLTVTLNRAQDKAYQLQIVGQMLLPTLPTSVTVPMIEPGDGMRARGQMIIGTDSAIQLVVKQTTGLSQIDNAAFGRVVLDQSEARAMPTGKAFAYSFPGMPISLDLSLDDIVPSYDSVGRLLVSVREDDLVVEGQVELDVRDAPLRTASIEVPGQFTVAQVGGPMVGDWRVTGEAGKATRRVEIQFKQPVLGNTVIGMRLELGKSPLGQAQTLTAPSVVGAKTQRGYVVMTAESSVQIDSTTASDAEILKSVNTASVPIRVANAQLAWRYREAGWKLGLQSSRKLAGVRAELFHLTSIGEGVTYGSVAVSYLITGSPIDQMQFVIPETLKNVEFVGRDVTGWTHDGERWTVRLGRKVMGDYNLAITYTQRYTEDQTIAIGGVRCGGVERQAGYIAIASHLNLKPGGDVPEGSALREIEREEVPANYRLLAHSPILRSFKYVDWPHEMSVKVKAYQHAELLPVVIEIADMNTRLDVRDDGACESITQIAYKIKNTSSQYLSLKLPSDAKFRRAVMVRYDGEGREIGRERVAASYDAKAAMLLLPLQRNVNPNEPVTVVMEYAQDHGVLGWSGKLSMAAPMSDVPATFAQWRVDVPATWAIEAEGAGNMVIDGEVGGRMDIAWVMRGLGGAWMEAAEMAVRNTQVLFGIAAVAGVFILTVIFKRRFAADVMVMSILLGVLAMGIAAGGGGIFHRVFGQPPHGAVVQFTQAVHMDPGMPLNVSVSVKPEWREHLQLVPAIIGAGVGLASVVMMILWRRLRVMFAAGGVVAGMYVASQFAVMSLPIGYALTWGLPAVLVIALVGRWMWTGLRGKAGKAVQMQAATVLVVAAMIGAIHGCASMATAASATDEPVVQTLEVGLNADQDSMSVDMAMKVSCAKAGKVGLLSDSVVLMTDDLKQRYLSVVREEGRYWLKMERGGKYEVSLKFLTPLGKADAEQMRKYEMPMPVAIANKVTLMVGSEDMQISAPDAVKLETSAGEKTSSATAVFMPGEAAKFIWKPRARQRENEKTIFYTTTTSVWRFDSGAVEGRHDIHFQISQGELKDIRVPIAEGVTVTSVDGVKVGAWRYEPTTHELEVRLSEAATGEYVLHMVTQIAAPKVPAEFAIGSVFVKDAARQHGTMGLLTSSSVYVNVSKGPQTMNVDDFARDSATLLKPMMAMGSSPVRFAYRVTKMSDAVQVTMAEVQPEIRAIENSGFTVTDERLQYVCSPLAVEVSKAGRFSIELRVPGEYDVDALSSPEVSHWDETTEDGKRVIQVHFRNKLQGVTELSIALSRAVSELPKSMDVPRVEVVGAIKHTGRVMISADRGVRLNVAERDGVSEIKAEELGKPNAQTDGFVRLAYRLLRPDWKLKLNTEAIEPLINVEYLHVANVSDGLVKHSHYLTYRLQHAGSKTFTVEVPAGAQGLQIIGEAIARREQIEPNVWRVELTRKWMDDRPYAMTIRYETPLDRDANELVLKPVVAKDVDLQRGYVVIDKEDRVEIEPVKIGQTLSATDARLIRGFVGAGDVSSAAYAYRSTAASYELAMKIRRLAAAAQLEAQVKQTVLTSVITQRGEMMTQVQMNLRVGSKRLLEMRLPDDAVVWSLAINGKATAPSERIDDKGKHVMLVPLAQGAVGEVEVSMSLIYVQSLKGRAWSGEIAMDGPQFDLPLGKVTWRMYVPDGFVYDDFAGTMTVNEQVAMRKLYQSYDVQVYDRNVIAANKADYSKARKYQEQGQQLAEQGKGYEARVALENGWNYSQSDASLNEDIRVQLHNLLRQQAKVGLVGSRSRLRGDEEGPGANIGVNGEDLAPQHMQQIEATLDQADSDNLNVITNRMIDIQEAAAGQTTQLVIDMPLRGRVLEFERALQITANAPMRVSFTAVTEMPRRIVGGTLWLGGLFIVLVIGMGLCVTVIRRWPEVRAKLTPAVKAHTTLDESNTTTTTQA